MFDRGDVGTTRGWEAGINVSILDTINLQCLLHIQAEWCSETGSDKKEDRSFFLSRIFIENLLCARSYSRLWR